VEFTGVELATPVEKVTTGLVEKAAAGGRRSGEGGRSAAVLSAMEMSAGGAKA
jgi:hypothetical protein